MLANITKSLLIFLTASLCLFRKTKNSAVAERPLDCLSVVSFRITIPQAHYSSIIISYFGFSFFQCVQISCSVLFGVTVDLYKRSRRLLLSTYFHRTSLFTTLSLYDLREDLCPLRFGITIRRYKRSPTFGVIDIHDGRNMLTTSTLLPVVDPIDIGRKSRFLSQLRRPRRNVAARFGMEKLEWCGYPTVKCLRIMFTRFDTIHERDGQTDGRTPHHSIDSACSQAALGGKNRTLTTIDHGRCLKSVGQTPVLPLPCPFWAQSAQSLHAAKRRSKTEGVLGDMSPQSVSVAKPQPPNDSNWLHDRLHLT